LKKVFTIGLTAFYLFLTAGLPITVHYCHGHIEEINILTKNITCCEDMEMPVNNCCEIKDMSDCCSNEYYVYQLDIDEEITKPFKITKSVFATIMKAQVFDLTVSYEDDDKTCQFFDLPPPANQSLWLVNCNFTFYG